MLRILGTHFVRNTYFIRSLKLAGTEKGRQASPADTASPIDHIHGEFLLHLFEAVPELDAEVSSRDPARDSKPERVSLRENSEQQRPQGQVHVSHLEKENRRLCVQVRIN